MPERLAGQAFCNPKSEIYNPKWYNLLQQAGYDALTVKQQGLGGEADATVLEICQQEQRILVSLDLDFSDIHTYPPQNFAGIIVMRTARQDKPYLLAILSSLISLLARETVKGKLWIVEDNRIRIRGD